MYKQNLIVKQFDNISDKQNYFQIMSGKALMKNIKQWVTNNLWHDNLSADVRPQNTSCPLSQDWKGNFKNLKGLIAGSFRPRFSFRTAVTLTLWTIKKNCQLIRRVIVWRIRYLYFPIPYSGMPTWFWTCFL